MKKTIKDINVKGKYVFVRCDLNVPRKDGVITDDKRIRAALPTIKYLLGKGGRLVLCSHMGRPKGKVDPSLSLAPVAARLTHLLGQDVPLATPRPAGRWPGHASGKCPVPPGRRKK